jgi:hypothetical protein
MPKQTGSLMPNGMHAMKNEKATAPAIMTVHSLPIYSRIEITKFAKQNGQIGMPILDNFAE